MAKSNTSAASYLSANTDYAKGAKEFPTEKLSKEVGRINDLSGNTEYTPNASLEDKQKQSTTGGCGTSFTTATDPKNISVKHDINGNFVEVATVNDQGDVQKKWITSSGTSMTFAEDGSIIFTTSKRSGDHNTGRFDAVSQGSTRFKIGESLMIVVENKNNVVAAKDAATKGPAMSIVVYGNIDVTSVSGEVNVKGKNINLNAESELKLSAGSKISLLSGKGKGKNKKEKTSSGTKEAKVEYGGVVEIQSGDFVCNSLTTRKTSSMDYSVVEAEGAVLATKELANYGFQSPGSFTVDIKGDLHEKIGGLRRTEILNTAPSKSTLLPGQKDGWLTTVGKVKGYAVSTSATEGGYSFATAKGDVSLYTKSGAWIVASDTVGAVAGIDKDKKSSSGSGLNLVAGVQLTSYKKDIYIQSGGSKIAMGLGTVTKGTVSNGITITQAKVEIKNTKGIYLN